MVNEVNNGGYYDAPEPQPLDFRIPSFNPSAVARAAVEEGYYCDELLERVAENGVGEIAAEMVNMAGAIIELARAQSDHAVAYDLFDLFWTVGGRMGLSTEQDKYSSRKTAAEQRAAIEAAKREASIEALRQLRDSGAITPEAFDELTNPLGLPDPLEEIA